MRSRTQNFGAGFSLQTLLPSPPQLTPLALRAGEEGLLLPLPKAQPLFHPTLSTVSNI